MKGCGWWSVCTLSWILLMGELSWPCASSRFQNDESSEEYFGQTGNGTGTDVGLSPPVGNLAASAIITTNATCGQKEPETFCKLVEHVNSRSRSSQCQICDAHSPDRSKRHPIAYAIDGSDRWWQSPTLQNGKKFEWVTITIDLKQAYQVAYIVIKAALSPRPGNWILEKSLDGVHFFPWQYFGVTDEECWVRYGIPARPGKPSYTEDDEVICTSYFSKISPFEGGEIHTSLVNGRPGAGGPSEKLVKFTIARYVRLRLQKIRTLHADLMGNAWDKTVMRRYFYSIKDIAIGGHCVCFGHSSECVRQSGHHVEKCLCRHNTCGENCDMCCPLYNQYPWGPGNSTASAACEQCQCYGHADSCTYDPQVDSRHQSINIYGTYSGGGICLRCKAHTAGINCEKCETGYFRPLGVALDDANPCIRCDCGQSPGSTGMCVTQEKYTAERMPEGKNVGDCECHPGYTGKHCTECSEGFHGYPNCVPCPCNLNGILNMDCEGECVCKVNVEGKYCASCKSGYFNLEKSNPSGCTQCFCHGVTASCRSSNLTVTKIPKGQNWSVTDLDGTKVIPGIQIGDTFHVANEEFSSFPKYYWTSKEFFQDLDIDSYGLSLIFRLSWVQARGDTSGRPISDFDILIQSQNSVLAFSHNVYEGNNATIGVRLSEHGCFVIPDLDNTVGVERTPQELPCSRYDIMEALSGVKQVLLRAKYHTDQIESMLHEVTLEKAAGGESSAVTGLAATSIEICACPTGYAGNSCEKCDYGYRKSSMDSWLNECVKCDCHGHARSCDLDGTCHACEHNTNGSRCENCLEGFFGEPSTEAPDACKRCECPLSIASNNFSPTCSLSGTHHVCTDCSIGYEGPFCERCSNGYFGNPALPGDYCQPCSCDPAGGSAAVVGEVCNHLTGECFICPKNTVGWNCDECLKGYYGNPLNGSCLSCGCHQIGASSPECHFETGQCECNERFSGKSCEVCIPGCGNVDQGCPPCSCDPVGSETLACDRVTGQCSCKSGVTGRYCNQCLEFHYGFSTEGCRACDCHSKGSDSQFCDLLTGHCHCLRNVESRNCQACAVGYWNIDSGHGCESCKCDPIGSEDAACHVSTGQCTCKSGVGGLRCDQCLEKHFGFSSTGCKECDPCTEVGHVCDDETGRCVCPPNVEGTNCSSCTVGYWGSPASGCFACNCSLPGSISPQCSGTTGKCACSPGYDGDKCSLCSFGFYNYPSCVPCGCEQSGSLETFCDPNGVCSCDPWGQCPCKKNVIGQACNKCKDGAFGLSQGNPEGCSDCFCFQRTSRCSEGHFKWQRLALPNQREVIPSWQSRLRLNVLNNLIVIPESGSDVLIEKGVSFSAPLYWQLPQIFLGDKVLSHNGFLRFRIVSEAIGTPFPHDVLSSYPLVQIQGNHRLILEHFPKQFSPTGYYEVKLNGDSWRLKHGPSDGLVTKEIMMVALQNLQHVLIRGTSSPEILKATLFNVSIDIAVLATRKEDARLAPGVEVCECPAEYNSTSCQNPTVGYYRWYKKEYITSTVIIDLIGEARACQCNGRSSLCDTETGRCQNCSDNTGGNHCEECALGFYGDPSDHCSPCPCPTVRKSHANSCLRIGPSNFQCFCREGYTGKSCERCDYGFYGDPNGVGRGHCEPCQCNPYGSVSDECDEVTGQCNCRPGITGRDCSKCSARNVIIGKMCTSCDDACTGTLLDEVERLGAVLGGITLTADDAAVWLKLHNMELESKNLSSGFGSMADLGLFIDDIPTHDTLASIILSRATELASNSHQLRLESWRQRQHGAELQGSIQGAAAEIHQMVKQLRNYTAQAQGINIPAAAELMRGLLDSLQPVSFFEAERAVNSELSLASDAFKDAFRAVFQTNSSVLSVRRLSSRLDDIKHHINNAVRDQSQADRLMSASRELLGTGEANAAAIEEMVLDMDMENVAALDILNRGAYAITEINEVLMMSEDIVRDLRNLSKEVEIRESNLFELVPLYRVNYAQPAFDHVEFLKQKASYMEGLYYFATSNNSKAHQAITAYDRMREGFQTGLMLARNAANISKEIQTLLRQFPLEAVRNDSDALIEDGFTLRQILEKSIRGRLDEYRDSLEGVKWRLRSANESLAMISNQIDRFHESRAELQIPSLIGQIEETFEFWEEIGRDLDETEKRIDRNLQHGLDDLESKSDFNSVQLDTLMGVVGRNLNHARHKSSDVESVKVRKETKMADTDERLKYLKALISQAKHKADTVRVAIGPDDTGTCFRLYKWPVHGGATTVTFNFAPIKISNSLLFYWPSSITEDFVSIEMIGLQIKASWNLGSGKKTLEHPLKLIRNREEQPDDPDIWYHISYKRVGADVSLGVSKVDSSGPSVPPPPEEYSEVDENNSTVMDLGPSDLIHIGGISNQRRAGVMSNGLSGCIHNLRVNHDVVGLWNFVGNEGCAPCTECTASILDAQNIERDYYFDGRGYSIVQRITSQAFSSKFFDINMEFRTYAETGLLFFTANEATGQGVSLEIRSGQVLFRVRHSWRQSGETSIHLETTGEKVNTGKWIKVQALWVYQNFLQTGQLSVLDKQYTQQIESSDLSLDLYNAPFQIGGLSPEFYSPKWHAVTNESFIGCLKNLLIDGNAYDPLAYQYFGVETPCGGKMIHVTSFEGNGYAEYASRPMTKDRFKFGFSFKTTSPTGLLLLSAFTKKANTSEEPYYAVYLENGEIHVQINVGNGHGLVKMADNHKTRYDDGKIHDFRLIKKAKKFLLYMDDDQVGVQGKAFSIPMPSAYGLFIGGASSSAQEKLSKVLVQVQKGFAGCLENLYFDNEILNFNHPLTHQNQNLGQCPPHFNSVRPSPFSPEYFSRIRSLAHVGSIPDEEKCSGAPSDFPHEELHTALHFGDSPDSYVGIPLEGPRTLRQQFNLTFHFRTFYPHGLIFQGVKKKGEDEYHILAYLKDGQLIFKLANRLWSQEMVSSRSYLNDGNWHMVWIVKSDEKMVLYIDAQLASEARVSKRMKPINKLYLGGIPVGGTDFLENSIQKPDPFKGCIRKLVINSHEYEFNATSVVRHQVNPCFQRVQSGSFFGGDSYAIYMYNFTFNSPIELELEFKTNSKSGELITFIPDWGRESLRQSSSFSIYLKDGQVVASERSGAAGESRAVEAFPESPDHLCDGRWHSVKANFIGRSISLKVDNFPNVDSLVDSTVRIDGNWREVTGTLFIGGDDGRTHSKRAGFHGCIKNISINQYRKDWSDMAALSKVFLNSCPS